LFLWQNPAAEQQVQDLCKVNTPLDIAWLFRADRGFDILDSVIHEVLRLSAHSIGAVRKVIAPEGYVLTASTGHKYFLPPNTCAVAFVLLLLLC
jgi:hypothetical protein